MLFYDCDMAYGQHIKNVPFCPCPRLEGITSELKRAGISGALVYNVAADAAGAVVGNSLLSSALLDAPEGLYGVWTLLPPCTRELPPASELPRAMRASKIRVLRVNPSAHRYMARAAVLKAYLDMACERHIPIHFDTNCGISLEQIDDIMSVYPALTTILSLAGCWPDGRMLYDVLDRYPNLHINTAFMITDQSIEEVVLRFGSRRLLYGSHFPECYTGAQMLHIAQANIAESDKSAIAGDNFLRLINGADLS